MKDSGLINDAVAVTMLFPFSLEIPLADIFTIRLPHVSIVAVISNVSFSKIGLRKFVVIVIVGAIERAVKGKHKQSASHVGSIGNKSADH